jgi:hypothetical protein
MIDGVNYIKELIYDTNEIEMEKGRIDIYSLFVGFSIFALTVGIGSAIHFIFYNDDWSCGAGVLMPLFSLAALLVAGKIKEYSFKQKYLLSKEDLSR